VRAALVSTGARLSDRLRHGIGFGSNRPHESADDEFVGFCLCFERPRLPRIADAHHGDSHVVAAHPELGRLTCRGRESIADQVLRQRHAAKCRGRMSRSEMDSSAVLLRAWCCAGQQESGSNPDQRDVFCKLAAVHGASPSANVVHLTMWRAITPLFGEITLIHPAERGGSVCVPCRDHGEVFARYP